MEIVNIHKAKSTLSSLIERVLKGGKIVIAKNGEPVDALEKIKKERGKRVGLSLKEKSGSQKTLTKLVKSFCRTSNESVA